MTDAADRDRTLREMLGEFRREIEEDIHSRVRHGLAERSNDVGDDAERSDSRLQQGIEIALIQARSQLRSRIDEALRQLDAGTYGSCCDCGQSIAERRLRALPFAVRCQVCEKRREWEQARARRLDARRDRVALFVDATGR